MPSPEGASIIIHVLSGTCILYHMTFDYQMLTVGRVRGRFRSSSARPDSTIRNKKTLKLTRIRT